MFTEATDQALTKRLLEIAYAGRPTATLIYHGQLANEFQVYPRDIEQKLERMAVEGLIVISTADLGPGRSAVWITQEGELLLSRLSKAAIGFAAH